MTMKKFSNYFVYAMCLFTLAFSTGAYLKANASTAPGQPVDLTYAADKALPAVVHIKYLQNSKVQTVEMQSDPFEDFFGSSASFSAYSRASCSVMNDEDLSGTPSSLIRLYSSISFLLP